MVSEIWRGVSLFFKLIFDEKGIIYFIKVIIYYLHTGGQLSLDQQLQSCVQM